VFSRRVGAFTATTILTMALSIAVSVQPAQAWGSAYAFRHCGINDTASYQPDNWATTRRVEGDCAGPVGAAMRRSSGWHSRAWHSSWAFTSGGSGNVGGSHWGCPTCNQSIT
jgi:hypothetical protein